MLLDLLEDLFKFAIESLEFLFEFNIELVTLVFEEMFLLLEILCEPACVLHVSSVCTHHLLHNELGVVEMELSPSSLLTVAFLDVVNSTMSS